MPILPCNKFMEWLRVQNGRIDSVGGLARWFSSPLKKDPKHCHFDMIDRIDETQDTWLGVITSCAANAHRRWLYENLATAWKEFHEKVEDVNAHADAKTSAEYIQVRPTIARLRKVVKGSHERGEEETEETIRVMRYHGPTATVGVRARLTTSIGNDWVQYGVSLEVPCYPEEIDDAYAFGEEWTTERVRAELDGMSGNQDSRHELTEMKDSGESDKVDDHSDTGVTPKRDVEAMFRAVADEVKNRKTSEPEPSREKFRLEYSDVPTEKQDDTDLMPGEDYGI